jgi:hypothetical protein
VLLAIITRCGGMLDAMGLHLGPHALHNARLHGAARSSDSTPASSLSRPGVSAVSTNGTDLRL